MSGGTPTHDAANKQPQQESPPPADNTLHRKPRRSRTHPTTPQIEPESPAEPRSSPSASPTTPKHQKRPRKPKKERPKLNKRQQKFIEHYTDPKDPAYLAHSQAALAAGYSKLAPETAGRQVLGSNKVRRQIERILDAGDATLEKGVRVISEAMDAKDRRVFLSRSGKVIYSEPLTDHATRLKGSDQMFKLRGLYTQTLQVPGLDKLADQIAEARKRSLPTSKAQDVAVEDAENDTKQLTP